MEILPLIIQNMKKTHRAHVVPHGSNTLHSAFFSIPKFDMASLPSQIPAVKNEQREGLVIGILAPSEVNYYLSISNSPVEETQVAIEVIYAVMDETDAVW